MNGRNAKKGFALLSWPPSHYEEERDEEEETPQEALLKPVVGRNVFIAGGH
jgi:hypothetical protein